MDELLLINKKNKNIKTLVMLENQKIDKLLILIEQSMKEKQHLSNGLRKVNDSHEYLNNLSLSMNVNQYLNPDLLVGQNEQWLKLNDKHTVLKEESELLNEELSNNYNLLSQSKKKISILGEMREINNSICQDIQQKKDDLQTLEQLVFKGYSDD